MTSKEADKPEIEMESPKHPLEHTWSFWLFTNENKKNWIDNLVELTHFNTVEDYWCLYHYMKQPSELKQGQDYAVFKRGISPMWEDDANRMGGRWLVYMDKRSGELDRYWLDTVLLMIGENFNESNETICGAVVNIRAKMSKISLWTRTKDEKSMMVIGRKVKKQLKIHSKLQFCVHDSNEVLYVC